MQENIVTANDIKHLDCAAARVSLAVASEAEESELKTDLQAFRSEADRDLPEIAARLDAATQQLKGNTSDKAHQARWNVRFLQFAAALAKGAAHPPEEERISFSSNRALASWAAATHATSDDINCTMDSRPEKIDGNKRIADAQGYLHRWFIDERASEVGDLRKIADDPISSDEQKAAADREILAFERDEEPNFASILDDSLTDMLGPE